MLHICKKLFFIGLISIGFWACEKDEIKAMMNPDAGASIQASTQNLVLTADNSGDDVLTLSSTDPNLGYAGTYSYLIEIIKKGGNWNTAYAISTNQNKVKTFVGAELNGILLGMDLEPEVAHQLEFRYKVVLSSATSLVSDPVTITITPYAGILDLSTTWGIVGDATPNGWGAPDMPFYKTAVNNVLVAYVKLSDGEIKFRKDQDWIENYGDSGADGTLDAGGDNIKVKAGTYKITMNLNTLKYSIEAYSWGLVGDATPNGWDGPDRYTLSYDPYTDQWRAIATFTNGTFKIRLNNDWAVNYGDNGANGSLDDGGDNISVEAGTYLVTVNFNQGTYTLDKLSHAWGIVGSAAPNGWDGPDAQMMPDFSRMLPPDYQTKGVWVIKNLVLTEGHIKFRANNDWAINYGGSDGNLSEGGADIAVTAGTYDIVLDLSGITPKYTLTKK